MGAFDSALAIRFDANAADLAREVFHRAYRAEAPRPRPIRFGDHEAAAADWRQVVATYRFHDDPVHGETCVGFVNYIRVDDFFLTGGLCVDAGAYRRMALDEFADCQRAGGFAQCLLEWSARHLDGVAMVGYCGDRRALAAGLRSGYRQTSHRYLIVRPIAALDTDAIERLVARADRLGPF